MGFGIGLRNAESTDRSPREIHAPPMFVWSRGWLQVRGGEVNNLIEGIGQIVAVLEKGLVTYDG